MLGRNSVPSISRSTTRRVVLSLYGLCFAIGGSNHVRDFILRGPRPYSWAPLPAFEVYWSVLAFLDFAIVLLLAVRKIRTALALALIVMATDVAINVSATWLLGFTDFGAALLMQATFLGFILGSIGFIWPARRST